MAAKDQQILKNLTIVGLALTIPSVLVGGPLLGYGIAYLLMKNGASPSVVPVLVGVGSILALAQTFGTVKLMLRIMTEIDTSKKNNN